MSDLVGNPKDLFSGVGAQSDIDYVLYHCSFCITRHINLLSLILSSFDFPGMCITQYSDASYTTDILMSLLMKLAVCRGWVCVEDKVKHCNLLKKVDNV